MNALYKTLVTHTRLRPRHHHLRYNTVFLLLDLAALPRLKLFSHGRFNLFSFQASDYGDGSGDLHAYVRAQLARAGMEDAGARICLLTMPRFLGHAFNPLSLFLCHDEKNRLRAVMYEVNNTFRQRHSYLLPVSGDGVPVRQECGKAFYVSPFMEMDLHYHFSLHPPGDSLGLHITVEDTQGVVLRASMAGKAQPLTDAALMRAACAVPFLGLKIVAAIHWEALKLWLKGTSLRPRPAPPRDPVSLPRPDTESAL